MSAAPCEAHRVGSTIVRACNFPQLIPATLVKRYKRFLADVVLPSGETMTVHCANPGSMLGLSAAGRAGVAVEVGQSEPQARP